MKCSRSRSRSTPYRVLHERPAHRELVVRAEPAVHVDGTDLGGHARRLHDAHHGVHAFLADARHVLAIVDGEVVQAAELVGGERRPGDGAQDFVGDFLDALAMFAQLLAGHRMPPAAAPASRGRTRSTAAPFSPTTASTGHMRAMWSHQPAGRPVVTITRRPACLSCSSAVYAVAVSWPSVVTVSSMSVISVWMAAASPAPSSAIGTSNPDNSCTRRSVHFAHFAQIRNVFSFAFERIVCVFLPIRTGRSRNRPVLQ